MKTFFILVSRSQFTGGSSKFQKVWGCQKEGGSNIKRSLFLLFYLSRLMSHFVPVIPVTPATTLKERWLG